MFVDHPREPVASYQPTVSANAISGRFTQPTIYSKNLTWIQRRRVNGALATHNNIDLLYMEYVCFLAPCQYS